MEININKTNIADDEIIKAVEAAFKAGENAVADNDATSNCGYSYCLTVEVGGEPVKAVWYPTKPDATEDEDQCEWEWIDVAMY